MEVNSDRIRQLAQLARLELSPAEEDGLRMDLNRILSYMQILAGIDTAGIAPLTHSISQLAELRDDQVVPGVGAEAALGLAPERAGEFFAVPTVVELTRRETEPHAE